jgi:serine/threonine-protein kinase RsbW
VNWCVDAETDGSASAIRALVADHLLRHAVVPDDAALAAGMAANCLASINRSEARQWWVSLDWEELLPRMVLSPLAKNNWPAAGAIGEGLVPVAAGVALANESVDRLGELSSGSVEIVLGGARMAEEDIDPPMVEDRRPLPSDREEALAEIAVDLTRHQASGRTAEEAAAAVGAGLAARQGVAPGTENLSSAVEAFENLERRMGGEWFVAGQTETRAVFGNRRCPFGEAVEGAPHLCRMTSVMAGRLATAATGKPVRITLDERIALGDPQCRLIVDLTDDPRPGSHSYANPPAGWITDDAGDTDVTRGFRVGLSLRLPRDLLSVPVIRHLCTFALQEVGVIDDLIEDVALSLTEACANVIDHSGPGDAYDVELTIRPDACDIRVIDIGHGFDAKSLDSVMVEPSAEEGRGISLMHALMDQVRFRSEPETGTIVHLVKRLRYDDEVPARRLLAESLEAVADPESESQ